MRRDALVVAVLSLAVALSCASHLPPQLGQDAVSGCDVSGSPFVKVKITLNRSGMTCKATVDPTTVCVFQGGAIRFKVANNCGELIRAGEPALKITRPTPRSQAAKASPEAWTFKTCSAQFDSLADGENDKNALFCEVPDTIAPGTYKYGFTGQIDPLDPDIEVRKGR